MKVWIAAISIVGLLVAAPVWAQPASGVTVVYPPGLCSSDNQLLEVGTFKPDLTPAGEPEVVWTRNPRHFVGACQTSIEHEFTARYRIRVRCVDRTTKLPLSNWVKSLSGLTYPWPAECPQTPPAQPFIAPNP